MNGATCSGGVVLAVISAARAAEALYSLDARISASEPREHVAQPDSASSSPCSRTASSPRTL